jgi:hypothetical protein
VQGLGVGLGDSVVMLKIVLLVAGRGVVELWGLEVVNTRVGGVVETGGGGGRLGVGLDLLILVVFVIIDLLDAFVCLVGVVGSRDLLVLVVALVLLHNVRWGGGRHVDGLGQLVGGDNVLVLRGGVVDLALGPSLGQFVHEKIHQVGVRHQLAQVEIGSRGLLGQLMSGLGGKEVGFGHGGGGDGGVHLVRRGRMVVENDDGG